MASWRRKLLEIAPNLREELGDEGIYAAFPLLLEELSVAVRAGDDERIRKIFDFAEWCFRQPAKDMWNAAGVSFYEHLVDDAEVAKIVGRYLRRETFEEVKCLIELIRGPDAVEAIRRTYGKS